MRAQCGQIWLIQLGGGADLHGGGADLHEGSLACVRGCHVDSCEREVGTGLGLGKAYVLVELPNLVGLGIRHLPVSPVRALRLVEHVL